MTRDAARVRVWDLPTRLFHWALARSRVVALLIATACAIGVAAIARLDA